MSQHVGEFSIAIEQVDGYEFRVKFDKEQYESLMLDEPAPLSQDRAPNAARILAAAVGNCLSASLLFCLSRAGVKLEDIKSDVKVELTRNENRRLRIGHMEVTVRPKLSATGEKIDKCLETFEDFCVVTQSVREGLDVKVNVEPQ
ncbi:MAG: OsmC family protein [Myxococcales bacterium]|nr:OsmC family protein [Myxococcales bacterium]MCB9577621.1 OsmC family protein [Polyangiaceae bacterium]